MNSVTTNPLFAIAADKHKADLATGEFAFLSNIEANQKNYTLGFCRGVTHATDIFQKQIELLKTQLADLTKTKQ